MTLVLSLRTARYCLMASDRLVTLARGPRAVYAGNHDEIANKTLIVLLRDAVVAIGYAGSANLAGRPTDDWIADLVAPEAKLFDASGRPAMFGLKRPSRLRLHQLCNRIRTGLQRVARGDKVQVLLTGWRWRKGRAAPINVELRASLLQPSAASSLRPVWPATDLRWIGDPPARAALTEPFASYAGQYLDPETARLMLTDIIRQRASAQPTVGPHVTCVFLPRPAARKVVSCFDPEITHFASNEVEGNVARIPVSYTPWILSPTGFQSPTEASGQPGASSEVSFDGWTFEQLDTSDMPDFRGSNVYWARPQTRPPPPR